MYKTAILRMQHKLLVKFTVMQQASLIHKHLNGNINYKLIFLCAAHVKFPLSSVVI